jgi:hypothetical protein
MQEGLTLPNTTETTKVNATFSFRNQNDLDIFRKLLKIQEMSSDDFATKAIHHYIAALLESPSKLRNPNVEKLHGLTFGDLTEDDTTMPEPGEVSIEIRKSPYGEGEIYTYKQIFLGVFEGKSAQVLSDNEDERTNLSWGSQMYKGKKIYAFWRSV